MISFEYTVRDEVGLHARPAGKFVKKAKEYEQAISVSFNGKTADAKRLFAVIGLGVQAGDVIIVSVEGDSENETARELLRYYEDIRL